MRKQSFIPLMAIMAVILASFFSQALAAGFTLASPDIAEGRKLDMQHVLNGFGCAGKNISPALTWKNAPEGTKSFAVTVYDPDAPTGSGWWHWVVFNIPSSVGKLPAGAGNDPELLPTGAIQGRTDFGAPGYGGACPPQGHGDHRYVFTVYALDVPSLDIPADSSGAMVGFFLNAHALEKASITATFGR
ncbi:kinase inhibitor [Salidesulfovibrio onnuriiensis]|uniref:kinase inhibitor n=1 Tax=Salidesulfovibrio onnuriiensis TaxID=2583823 RepID=UPI0011CABE1E|nr:kinase inhibitor [Salidesulfovibrio onnuriiensis]